MSPFFPFLLCNGETTGDSSVSGDFDGMNAVLPTLLFSKDRIVLQSLLFMQLPQFGEFWGFLGDLVTS